MYVWMGGVWGVPSTKSLELAFHTVMLSCFVLSSAFVAPLLEPRAARFETKATSSAIHMAIGRREAAISLVSGAALAANVLPKSAWAADTEASLIAEIKEIRSKLDLNAINTLIDEEKWDAARSIWKVPPVNYAWEQSQNKKNPLKKLADLRDDVELFEVVDDIAQAMQLADQYCYSNTFIYTQPGNGKMKFKEPKQQIKIAVDKMDSFIS